MATETIELSDDELLALVAEIEAAEAEPLLPEQPLPVRVDAAVAGRLSAMDEETRAHEEVAALLPHSLRDVVLAWLAGGDFEKNDPFVKMLKALSAVTAYNEMALHEVQKQKAQVITEVNSYTESFSEAGKLLIDLIENSWLNDKEKVGEEIENFFAELREVASIQLTAAVSESMADAMVKESMRLSKAFAAHEEGVSRLLAAFQQQLQQQLSAAAEQLKRVELAAPAAAGDGSGGAEVKAYLDEIKKLTYEQDIRLQEILHKCIRLDRPTIGFLSGAIFVAGFFLGVFIF